jgi:hypothetical protein
MGGLAASTWASHNIDKVEALFLMSPAGMQAYDENNFDPYNQRNPENPTGPRIDKATTDKIIDANNRNDTHPYAPMASMPAFAIKGMIKADVKKKLEKRVPELGPDQGKPALSEPYIAAICEYQAIMTCGHLKASQSCAEIVQLW